MSTATTSNNHGEVVRVVMMGAGSSSSTPRMGCVVSSTPCTVCNEAHANPFSRNHRLNPSLLIQVRTPIAAKASEDGDANGTTALSQSRPYCIHGTSSASPIAHPDAPEYLNILIDCGKTFRESSLRHFPKLGVTNLHAVLLTHDHADACFGVDDLREFASTAQKVAMPVYLDGRTDETMRRVFGYLYPKTAPTDGRWVASLKWDVFEQGTVVPVQMSGPPTKAMKAAYEALPHDDRPVLPATGLMQQLYLPITSVPIEHGPNYFSNGFIFELMPGRVCVYYSDISRFDETDEARLAAVVGNRVIEVLVLDLLSTTPYFSHFNKAQAVACAIKVKAQHTYFVGMSHTVDYHKENAGIAEELKKHGVTGELAYDGCVLFDALNTTA